MRNLPFEDSSISFIYTQNSICHLRKNDHKKVIDEIYRVLKVGGYCLVDFLSVECSFCNEEGMGTLVGNYEYKMKNRDEDDFHSFFVDKEPNDYFKKFKIVRIDKISSDIRGKNSWIDVRYYYYAQKV